VDSGDRISKETADTMIPGTLTYGEVVAELGLPSVELDGQRVVAYLWYTHSGSARWGWGEYHDLGQRVRAFALQFDASQRLQRRAFFSETTDDKLRQCILAWAKDLSPSSGQLNPQLSRTR
jgi:hypothetical protein